MGAAVDALVARMTDLLDRLEPTADLAGSHLDALEAHRRHLGALPGPWRPAIGPIPRCGGGARGRGWNGAPHRAARRRCA